MVPEKFVVDVAVAALRKGPMWTVGTVVFLFGVAAQYNILLLGRPPWIGIALTALGAAVFSGSVVKRFVGLVEAKAEAAEAKAAHAEIKVAMWVDRAASAESERRKAEEECAGLRAKLQALRAQTGG